MGDEYIVCENPEPVVSESDPLNDSKKLAYARARIEDLERQVKTLEAKVAELSTVSSDAARVYGLIR